MSNSSERTFGMLSLPSGGAFYKNKDKYLLINYLTYFEENILTSEMMNESGVAIPLLLDRVIVNKDFDVKEILTCDIQAISMYLRAYAYGNKIEVDIMCPHCQKEDKHSIMMSDFKSKDIDLIPDENGELFIVTPKFGKKLKIKPRTYFEEVEFKGHDKQIESMAFNIMELDGERDRSGILKKLYGMKIMESREVKKAIIDNLPGIDTTINYCCDFCEKETKINFGNNGTEFLKLPASFMNNVLEEMFLLSYYGKGISFESCKLMSVGERRFFINRLNDEITKRNEMEAEQARKAKSKSKR